MVKHWFNMAGSMGLKTLLSEKAFQLYYDGYSLGEIAERLYGEDSRRNRIRVAALLYKYRKKHTPEPWREYLKRPQILPHEYISLANELVNKQNIIDFKKKYKDNRFAVQLATHEQLIYYVLRELGYRSYDNIVSTARYYHYKLFPLVWAQYGEKALRVWRNSSKSNRVFSVSFHSVAYVYSLVLGVLLLFGHGARRPELDRILRDLLPESRKHYMAELYALYERVGGYVLAKILMMTL